MLLCRLKNAKFPVDYLPSVVEPGIVAGHTAAVWHSIPKGTPVLAAMGDLQCSTLSMLPGPQDTGMLGLYVPTLFTYIIRTYTVLEIRRNK